jgi:hypothetical protein
MSDAGCGSRILRLRRRVLLLFLKKNFKTRLHAGFRSNEGRFYNIRLVVLGEVISGRRNEDTQSVLERVRSCRRCRIARSAH